MRLTALRSGLLALALVAPALAYDTNQLTSDLYGSASEVVQIPVENRALVRNATNLTGTLFKPVQKPGGPAVPATLPVIFVTTPYGRGGGGVTGGNPSTFGTFYASRGYLVLITDNRGTGDSDGALEFVKIEVDDAVRTVRWLQARSDVQADRIGMSGCSYLGGMQMMTAARIAAGAKPGLATIVPQAAWYDLGRAALPGGTPKTVVDALIIGIFSERALQPKSDGTAHTLDPIEATVPVQTLLLLDPYVNPSEEEYRARSVYPDLANIDIPIYFISSWKDDLIEVDHSFDLWRGVSTPAGQKKLTIGAGGHCAWTDATQEKQHAWLDRYLMDIPNGIDTDPPIDILVQGTNTVRSEPSWPVPGMAPVTHYLRAGAAPNAGSLSTTAPAGDETPDVVANVLVAGFNDGVQAFAQDSVLPAVPRSTPLDSAVYSLAVGPDGLELTGTPRISLAVLSTAPQVQFAAKLYERRADGAVAIVARGVHTETDYTLVPHRVEFDLFSTSYQLAPGSTLELHVANSDLLYVLPVPVPSLSEIRHTAAEPSWIELPVVTN